MLQNVNSFMKKYYKVLTISREEKKKRQNVNSLMGKKNCTEY